MRTPIIAGNWKMHLTRPEAAALVGQLRAACETEAVEVVVCPAFPALSAVAEALKGSRIGLGAQNVHWEAQGAFTGEVSAAMLRDVGCRYAIIGHSERRQWFGETDAGVARRTAAALAAGLTPIVCIGETLAQRDANETLGVLDRQLAGGLSGLDGEARARMVLAYEPVWAIGTGRTATPAQAQEAHAHIRGWLRAQCGAAVAETVRIQYGGSVNAGNAAQLLQQPDVDGALVGGASLKVEAFAVIVKAAIETTAAAKR